MARLLNYFSQQNGAFLLLFFRHTFQNATIRRVGTFSLGGESFENYIF
jgi:hypothetical protein